MRVRQSTAFGAQDNVTRAAAWARQHGADETAVDRAAERYALEPYEVRLLRKRVLG